MARRPRLAGRDTYHHVYAWGNDRLTIFRHDTHYEQYLQYLRRYSTIYGIDIVAYALMNWHIHLFLLDWSDRLSQFMNCLHGCYAQFFNRVNERVGHVFGERFNNRIVQTDEYGSWLSRYIHRQPVEAGLVSDPKDYRWTSYCEYIGAAPRTFLKPGVILGHFGSGKVACRRYEEFVLSNEEGPIDWSESSAVVIGDDKFKEDIALLTRTEHANAPADLVQTVSNDLAVDASVLADPRGLAERRLRHEAFKILIEKYGLSAADVARAFRVTPSAVTRVLER